MDINELNKIKDYANFPEGSWQKQIYDEYFLDKKLYINKYYSAVDLSRWLYIKNKFVAPLFDGTKWGDYWDFLTQTKPDFVPNEAKVKKFWQIIKDDSRFDIELKQFFTFLYSINFYRELSFEEWLASNNWNHPWYEDKDKTEKPILEIINYQNGINYLKVQFASLPIFK